MARLSFEWISVANAREAWMFAELEAAAERTSGTFLRRGVTDPSRTLASAVNE